MLILERFPIGYVGAIDIIANPFISYAEGSTPGEQKQMVAGINPGEYRSIVIHDNCETFPTFP